MNQIARCKAYNCFRYNLASYPLKDFKKPQAKSRTPTNHTSKQRLDLTIENCRTKPQKTPIGGRSKRKAVQCNCILDVCGVRSS